MMVGSSIGSVVLLSGAGGCLPEAPEGSGVEYRVDDDDGSIPAHNRTADGVGYVNNGLHDPDVGGFDPAYPLYMVEGLDGSRLTDPDRLFTAVYAVECALGPDQSVTKIVDGETVELVGLVGLAPEWEEGPCDTDCQEWVSACVLARTNVSGQEVALHLRGDHPALSGDPHPDYPHYEASFFGNLFTGPDHEYLCPGTLTGPVFAQLEGRTCSNVVGGYCDFTVYPLCLDTDPLWLLDRCDYAELVPPVASQCRTGLLPGGSPLRAISTYVGDVL